MTRKTEANDAGAPIRALASTRFQAARCALELDQAELSKGLSRTTADRIEHMRSNVGEEVWRVAEKVLFLPPGELDPINAANWKHKTPTEIANAAKFNRQNASPAAAAVLSWFDCSAVNTAELIGREVEISVQAMRPKWVDLIMCAKKSFCATNFITHDEVFIGEMANYALDAQALQVNLGRTIQKLFIFENDSEFEVYKSQMTEQHGRGCDVRHITLKGTAKKTCEIIWPHIDFGLIDEEVVLVWVLDQADRSVQSGRILFDPKQVEEYRTCFATLFGDAPKFKPEEQGSNNPGRNTPAQHKPLGRGVKRKRRG